MPGCCLAVGRGLGLFISCISCKGVLGVVKAFLVPSGWLQSSCLLGSCDDFVKVLWKVARVLLGSCNGFLDVY